MKRINPYLIAGALLAAAIWILCYSCTTEKSDSGIDTKPDTTVKTEIAGIGHNDCLDIFYKKLQQLKARKTRSGEGDELPPDGNDDDDQMTQEELEEAIVSAVVEGLDNMVEVEGLDKEEVKREFAEALAYCSETPIEEIEEVAWSAEGKALGARLEAITTTEYDDIQTILNDIKNVENSARQTLTGNEYDTFMMTTAIMTYSLEYWRDNYSAWTGIEPDDSTRGNFGRFMMDCVDVAWADIQGGLTVTGLMGFPGVCNGFPGSGLGMAVSRIVIATPWQVKLAIIAGGAAVGSIVEIAKKCIDETEIDTDELNGEFCGNMMEKAYYAYAGWESAEYDPGDDNGEAEEGNN